MKKWFYVLAATAASLIMVACGQTASPSLAGTYTWTVSKEEAAAQGWTGDLVCENSGNFQMLFSPTGASTLTQKPLEGCGPLGVPAIVGTWKVTGDQLEYHEITDTGCGTPTVIYKWKLDSNKLTLNKVSDTCQFSASDTAPKVWTKTQ